jgi:hypothetical protein
MPEEEDEEEVVEVTMAGEAGVVAAPVVALVASEEEDLGAAVPVEVGDKTMVFSSSYHLQFHWRYAY